MPETLSTMPRQKKPESEQTKYTTLKVRLSFASKIRELAAMEGTLQGRVIEQGKLLEEIMTPILDQRLSDAMKRRQKQLGS